MQTLIFGSEPPKISFTQSPDGHLSFNIENEFQVNPGNERTERISWSDLRRVEGKILMEGPGCKENVTFEELTNYLADLTQSKFEKEFFLNYVSCCGLFEEDWNCPALIPQVWVNWIHYDNKDPERAERAQKEPFRVDFIMKDERISRNLIIIEIDGTSHFSSMDAYTQHIRKDRWLRKQGWEVFRITNQEIQEVKDRASSTFQYFFKDIFGSLPADIPF